MHPEERPSRPRPFLGIAFLLAAVVPLLWRPGAISWTWDEQTDMGIVSCLDASRNPFHCLNEVSQARFPYYVHWAIEAVAHRRLAHYLASAAFAWVNLLLVFTFTRRRFGEPPALLAAALMAVSPALLASGRMLLTHSNAIFTAFTLMTVIAYDRFDQGGRRRWLWLSATAFGLATASSVLGVFNGLLIAGYWLTGRRLRPREMAGYVALAVAVFFAATVIYVVPENLRAFVDETFHGHQYDFWNYLGLGTSLAPRWYSFLLFAIKIGPWWAALFLAAPFVLARPERDRRFVFLVWAAFLVHLALKSAVFRYDAPHQQTPWYPLVYVVLALAVCGLAERTARLRPLVFGAFVLLLAVQVWDVLRFFPNYLFYGVQYGDRFIGEFYGPAVFHAQDRGEIDRRIDALIAADPSVRILVADNNAFDRTGPNFVRFTERDRSREYEYALVDRLYATHFHFPERDRYNRFLARGYAAETTHEFPLHEWAYRIMKRGGGGRIRSQPSRRGRWPT